MGNKFGIENFTLIKEESENKMYISHKEYIVFNKKVIDSDFVNYCLIIYLQKDNELSEYISSINSYIKWFNGNDCKNKLIKHFSNEKINVLKSNYVNLNKINEEKWYENLELLKATITIDKNKKIASKIICKDDNCKKNEILIFNANENGFYGMEYKNIENGLA